MKILLTGKNGQVGFELRRSLALLGDVLAVDQHECDLTDEAGLRRLVREFAPDVIVNPAAYTAVDKAETDTTIAYAVNAHAPQVLGEDPSKASQPSPTSKPTSFRPSASGNPPPRSKCLSCSGAF